METEVKKDDLLSKIVKENDKKSARMKFNFRAPQQYVKKKMWNKRHNNKADVENLQIIKNQIRNTKQIYNKKMTTHRNISETASGVSTFSVRSKFFLPDKRPRKEIIIPPTKFLLGGNISDPLNLNSLQDEAIFANANQSTPCQSSTTPPKVEIYLPPNINDPLHLLDPVDSIEYEKQLVSPMKRKSKHRHRKKKTKRTHLDSLCSVSQIEINFENTKQMEVRIKNIQSEKTLANLDNINKLEIVEPTFANDALTKSNKNLEIKAIKNEKVTNSKIDPLDSKFEMDLSLKNNQEVNAIDQVTGILPNKRSENRDKAAKDFKLELIKSDDVGSVTSRKRKISEGSSKNKFRRMDSMDKIVSPVVPQPGAWKRPPRNVPTGARKGSRKTSVSESDLISPSEECKCLEVEDNKEDIKSVVNSTTSIIQKDFFPTSAITEMSKLRNMAIPTNLATRHKFRPEGVKYQYGNYDRYSNYRNFNESMDVRLQVLLRNSELLKNKDILDIGCNAGHMTIAIGKRLSPKTILGVDIDSNLISRARRNLSFYVRIPNKSETRAEKPNKNTEVPRCDESAASQKPETIKEKSKRLSWRKRRQMHKNNVNNRNSNVNLFPISFPICYGGIPRMDMSEVSTSIVTTEDSENSLHEFPKNVFFKQTNYVVTEESLLNNDIQQYDIILCLSVTKWIHLNFGDAGLKLAFKRMFNQLRPGGKLILEAQNWASYKKKKNLTETIYNNYSNIEFFPNKFHEYLLSNEVGFSHSFTLGVPRHLSKGFCRPIQLYAKGDFTPNHVQWSDAYHPQTPYVTYRGIYASIPRPPYPKTPHGSGNTSCFQTPMYQPGSQYYNPLETDSYLPSYDTEILNRHYVFASPLYQTVWSPPASLRNSSTHNPVFGSVREAEMDGREPPRHVYPPNEISPSQINNAFSVREESEQEESPKREHVYANCDSSSSPKTDGDS